MSRRALHRWSFLLWFSVLLYGPHAPAATDALPAAAAAPAANPAEPVKAPHIALLLPTGSEVFAKAAEAVRDGLTIEQLGLQSGDQIRIGQSRTSSNSRDWYRTVQPILIGVSVFTALLAIIRASYAP